MVITADIITPKNSRCTSITGSVNGLRLNVVAEIAGVVTGVAVAPKSLADRHKENIFSNIILQFFRGMYPKGLEDIETDQTEKKKVERNY